MSRAHEIFRLERVDRFILAARLFKHIVEQVKGAAINRHCLFEREK